MQFTAARGDHDRTTKAQNQAMLDYTFYLWTSQHPFPRCLRPGTMTRYEAFTGTLAQAAVQTPRVGTILTAC